ncbi:uncharacterized protein [Nicotiana sylvestris]|uniref:uncharacterized protein n=1 Tax=Nicotiana sylvestris TaxID=4096 RepID=UPI00388CECDE
MNEKRQKGLCFFCDEKLFPGHKCSGSKQLYLLEVEEEGQEEEETGDLVLVEEPAEITEEVGEEVKGEVCEISVNALHGVPTFHNLRVTGYCQKRPLSILVDPGRTHNFIDDDVARSLGIATLKINPQTINVVDGNNRQTHELCKDLTWLLQGVTYTANFLLLPLGSCDLILGVQWLLPLGDLKLNFKELTLGEEEQTEVTINIPSQMQSLLEEYHQLFTDPKELPPFRGPFDHKIPLQAGCNPINLRLYKYSLSQKDNIERLVQDILDQGIVQPSSSPYVSPVVLVGKKDGSYYRRFIKHYGVISRPLTELLKKDGFQWSNKAEEAFNKLKAALTSAPMLALPNNQLMFVVETDTCDYGVGAVLMQDGHPIAYLSKGLSGRHQALSVYDKELLALVMAVTKWAQYLMGRHFVVRTD